MEPWQQTFAEYARAHGIDPDDSGAAGVLRVVHAREVAKAIEERRPIPAAVLNEARKNVESKIRADHLRSAFQAKLKGEPMPTLEDQMKKTLREAGIEPPPPPQPEGKRPVLKLQAENIRTIPDEKEKP